jgi:hypothetical protein
VEITELGELAQVHDVDDRKLLGESGLTTVGDLKVSALRVLDESSLLQVSPSPAEAVGENFLVPTRRGGRLAIRYRRNRLTYENYLALAARDAAPGK